MRGSVNAEVIFRFVVWNVVTEVYDALPITTAFTSPGFAEGIFQRPSGVVTTYALADAGETADGKASFYTPSGFLDELGEWRAAGRVKLPGSGIGTGVFPSVPVTFRVESGLLNSGSGVVLPDPLELVVSIPNPNLT